MPLINDCAEKELCMTTSSFLYTLPVENQTYFTRYTAAYTGAYENEMERMDSQDVNNQPAASGDTQ